MIELFNNIITWFVTNAQMIKTIAAVICAILLVIVLIIVLVHKKLISTVNTTVDELSKIVDDYKSVMTELEHMKQTIEQYDVTTNKSVDKMITVENVDTQLLKKINSVLDILALAYSTIKNDEIRLGITNIVNYAKYLDPTNELIKTAEINAKQTQKVLEQEASKVIAKIESKQVEKLDKPKKVETKETVIRRC